MAQTVTTTENSDGSRTTTFTDTPQDSIELSVNAKGEPSWCVKAYGHNAADLKDRLADLRALAEKHAAEIRAGKGA